MLGSGNGAIGGMAADARTDVGEDNTHWMTGEGQRQTSTVLLYPQVRVDTYNGGGVTCQVENTIARHGSAKHQSSREGEHWRLQKGARGAQQRSRRSKQFRGWVGHHDAVVEEHFHDVRCCMS